MSPPAAEGVKLPAIPLPAVAWRSRQSRAEPRGRRPRRGARLPQLAHARRLLTGFGARGAVAAPNLPAGEGKGLIASALGVASGIALSGVYLAAMRLIQSQEAISPIGDRELIGLEGHITVPIPADGVGEVACPVGGQTTRRMARAAGPLGVLGSGSRCFADD